jgi:NTP pyrophosphatase (non-canonical NTP hydrolase)
MDNYVSVEDYETMVAEAAIYKDAVNEFVAAGSAGDVAKLFNVFYATTGLAGEAGEVANKVKKIIRDNKGIIDGAVRQKVLGELGGVAWYLAAVSAEFGLSLNDVLAYNYDQITDRQERNVLHGDGDDR